MSKHPAKKLFEGVMKGVKGVGDTIRGVSPTNTDPTSQPPAAPHTTPLPDSPTSEDLAAGVDAAAPPVPHGLPAPATPPIPPLRWEDDALFLTPPTARHLTNQESLQQLSPEVPEEEGGRFVCDAALKPPGTARNIANLIPVESMDSTPGSAKRSRPTDSPAKGQPKSKIAAQDISPADQADSSPDMEAAKRADRPPGLLQWEEEKKAMQAQISQLMHQTNLQAGFIQAQAAEFNASLLQMDTKLNAALERTVQQVQQQVHNSISASTQSTTAAMKEVEARVVKQISHVTAKVLACENAVDSHERRFAAMDKNISELMRGTEDKLRELRIRREASMEVDGQAQATVGRPPDRDIAFQITGINSIKPYVEADPDADAADIAIELMELFGEYHAVLRIVIVDIKGKTRQTADSVIVYMSSTFHKKKATNYLRQFLKTANEKGWCKGVTVRDCFDLAEQPRARALNRFAAHLREEQQIDGFRILNNQGTAVLQTYIGYQKWTEYKVQPEELQPYYLTRQEREQQQQGGSSSSAAQATAPPNINQQAQHTTQKRLRGGGQGRGAARGAGRGGRAASGAEAAAQLSLQQQRGSPAPTTHPNNIPIRSGGWKPARQAQTEKRMQIFNQKRQQDSEQKSREQQSSDQIPLQSAPLSAEQREQERKQKDKEDADALRRIEEAAAEQRDTILRRKAAREDAENRKVCDN
jgi:hypothetical protein